MSIRRRWTAPAVLVLAASALVPNPSAVAQDATLNVEVGVFLSENPAAESMRFFPASVNVHEGDKIHFYSESFHTATLLPENTSAQDWIDANTKTPDQPYFVAKADPDDGAGAFKYNPAVFFPSHDCGTGGSSCDVDGSEVVSSGTPLAGPTDFTVQINVSEGDHIWVVCLIHPHMRMKINVVPNSSLATTQSQIDATKAAQLDQDLEWALATDARYRNKQSTHTAADGTKVWDAWAGVDNHWVTLYPMYPAHLKIRKGQNVRFHFDSLIMETHTVTLPHTKAFEAVANDFLPQCDPDGDSGAGPDTNPTSPPDQFPSCPTGSTLEIDAAPEITTPAGDGVYTGGNDFENSGIRGVLANNYSPMTVRFTKATGKKPLKYICLIHPFMVGKITVK